MGIVPRGGNAADRPIAICNSVPEGQKVAASNQLCTPPVQALEKNSRQVRKIHMAENRLFLRCHQQV